jgi:hypothetical protein
MMPEFGTTEVHYAATTIRKSASGMFAVERPNVEILNAPPRLNKMLSGALPA